MHRIVFRRDRARLFAFLAGALAACCGCESETRTTAATDNPNRPAASSPGDAVIDQDAARAKETLRQPRRDQAKRPPVPAADRGLRVVDQPRVTPTR